MAKNQNPKGKEIYSDRVNNAIKVAQDNAKQRQVNVNTASKKMKETNAQAIKVAQEKKKKKI